MANQTYEIKLGDITKLHVDAIVNATDRILSGEGGVDAAIHKAGGEEMDRACHEIGRCAIGDAQITKGYKLPAEYVIHTVGPEYKGANDDCALLASCYTKSLDLAKKYDVHGIAFPAIATGTFGYPLEIATHTAMITVKAWFDANPDYAIHVIFCCHSEKDKAIYCSVSAKIM